MNNYSVDIPSDGHEHENETSPLLRPDTEGQNTAISKTTTSSFLLPCEEFAWRSVALGGLIGCLVCLTNIHFGLQTGYINIMSMPSALIGFGVFEVLKKHLILPFTPAENVLVQTVASAVGAIPATAGLVGAIPALELLMSPADGGPANTNLLRLCIWSLGVSAFGLVFAVILRDRIIIKEKLRFPTGTATAVMVNVLHDSKGDTDSYPEPTPRSTSDDEPETRYSTTDGSRTESSSNINRETSTPQAGLKIIFIAMPISALYTIISYFLPILHNIPIFGTGASSTWLWSFNLSLGFFGQGVITGPKVLFNMLAGAIVGWGILSPIAKSQGWAPGPVGDWDTGSRGWTIWICLSAMLADALVDLAWFVLQTALSLKNRRSPFGGALEIAHQRPELQSSGLREVEYSLVWYLWLAIGLLSSIAIAVLAVAVAFGRFMPAAITMLAIVISLPLCVMGVKAVGTTDHNPASGIAKICQLIIGYIIPRTSPNAKLINLVAGGIAEAGAVQSGFMMQNFKTGHLSGSSADTQFFGQLIGSFIGAILASGLYKLYTSVYSLPNDIFQIPSAYVWRAGASLSVGEGLPPRTPIFGSLAAVIFAIFAAIRIAFGKGKWCTFVPMGIPFSVGMYNTPSFTLARALGGLTQWYWTSKMKKSETSLMVFASGLVLGEGLASIVNLVLEASSVPHL